MERQTKKIGIGMAGAAALAGAVILAINYAQPAPATQPVVFNHRTHVQERARLKCLSCHATANRSTHAGIPSVSQCLLCHRGILPDHPEIQKLSDFHERGQEVAWQQVYHLPDFVYFSHKRHVKVGIECHECHGDVAQMKEVQLVVTHTMGSCIACHQQRGAPIDCLACHK